MSYSPEYFTARESWRDWRTEARELIRLARITRGSRVLEIGCGGGGLLRMLRERGAWVVGVDTLGVALILAWERFDAATLRRGDAEKSPASSRPRVTVSSGTELTRISEDGSLPFRDNSFDAIIGQHVIEHIADAAAALREWKRVLKPGGRLALATPNARYPDPTHFADPDHARIFSPAELRDALARAGYVVETAATVFPYLTQTRILRGIGILAFKIFQRAPYFSSRGRTILVGARG